MTITTILAGLLEYRKVEKTSLICPCYYMRLKGSRNLDGWLKLAVDWLCFAYFCRVVLVYCYPAG